MDEGYGDGQVGEGLQLKLSLCVPQGSLQEQLGYELGVQELVTVQEGLCIYLPCSFSYPWSSGSSPSQLYTYWYWHGDDTNYDYPVATNNLNKPVKRETQGHFLLVNTTRNNMCSLRIRDARKSDTGTYIFRVERGRNVKYTYRDKMLTLQVTGMPGAQERSLGHGTRS